MMEAEVEDAKNQDFVIDLECAIFERPEDAVHDWNSQLLNTFANFSINESYFNLEPLLKRYLKALEETTEITDVELLREKVSAHIQYIYLLYCQSDSPFDDTYLECMEDILTCYINLVVKCLDIRKKKEKYKTYLNKISNQLINSLSSYLLDSELRIFHVLIKVNMKIDRPLSANSALVDLLNILLSHFLLNKIPEDKSDEGFCRGYILFQTLKEIKKPELRPGLDKAMLTIYSRTNCDIKNLEKIYSSCTSPIEALLSVTKPSFRLGEGYFKYMKSRNNIEENFSIDNNACEDEIEDESDDEDSELSKAYQDFSQTLSIISSVKDESEMFSQPSSGVEMRAKSVQGEVIEVIVLEDDDEEDDLCVVDEDPKANRESFIKSIKVPDKLLPAPVNDDALRIPDEDPCTTPTNTEPSTSSEDTEMSTTISVTTTPTTTTVESCTTATLTCTTTTATASTSTLQPEVTTIRNSAVTCSGVVPSVNSVAETAETIAQTCASVSSSRATNKNDLSAGLNHDRQLGHSSISYNKYGIETPPSDGDLDDHLASVAGIYADIINSHDEENSGGSQFSPAPTIEEAQSNQTSCQANNDLLSSTKENDSKEVIQEPAMVIGEDEDMEFLNIIEITLPNTDNDLMVDTTAECSLLDPTDVDDQDVEIASSNTDEQHFESTDEQQVVTNMECLVLDQPYTDATDEQQVDTNMKCSQVDKPPNTAAEYFQIADEEHVDINMDYSVQSHLSSTDEQNSSMDEQPVFSMDEQHVSSTQDLELNDPNLPDSTQSGLSDMEKIPETFVTSSQQSIPQLTITDVKTVANEPVAQMPSDLSTKCSVPVETIYTGKRNGYKPAPLVNPSVDHNKVLFTTSTPLKNSFAPLTNFNQFNNDEMYKDIMNIFNGPPLKENGIKRPYDSSTFNSSISRTPSSSPPEYELASDFPDYYRMKMNLVPSSSSSSLPEKVVYNNSMKFDSPTPSKKRRIGFSDATSIKINQEKPAKNVNNAIPIKSTLMPYDVITVHPNMASFREFKTNISDAKLVETNTPFVLIHELTDQAIEQRKAITNVSKLIKQKEADEMKSVFVMESYDKGSESNWNSRSESTTTSVPSTSNHHRRPRKNNKAAPAKRKPKRNK